MLDYDQSRSKPVVEPRFSDCGSCQKGRLRHEQKSESV